MGCTSHIAVGQFQNPQPFGRTSYLQATRLLIAFLIHPLMNFEIFFGQKSVLIWHIRADGQLESTGNFTPGQSQLCSRCIFSYFPSLPLSYLVLSLQTRIPTPLTPGNKAFPPALNRASMISIPTAWVPPAPAMQPPAPSCLTSNVFVLQWKQILKLGETRQFNALL